MVDETKLNSENLVDGAVNANEGQAPDAKKTELDEAIALVNSGLDDLSPEDLAKVYAVLKSHSGEVGDAGTAFAKLDAFSQKKLENFADGKENVAPEELAGIEALTAEAGSVHKENGGGLNNKIAKRVKSERENFDKNNSLESLTTDSAPMLKDNLAAVDAILAANPPLAVKEDKTLVNPEMQNFVDFMAHIDLAQDSEGDGAKSKEELTQEALELAILEAQEELALTPGFSKLSDAEKRKKTMQSVASHLDAMALQMLKAQMLADFQTENAELLAKKDNLSPEEQKQLDEKVKEFNARMKQVTNSYLGRKYPAQNFNLSNSVASSVTIAGGRNLVARTTRIEEKTGFALLKERALRFDAKMKAKHPKIYSAAKKGMVTGVVSYASGGVGLAVLAGIRSYKLVRASYKTYKESGFEGSYMGYLKANPKEMTSLITSVALTGVTAAFAGADVYINGLSGATGLAGKVFGENIANHAADRVLKASIRGGISLTSGLSSAVIDWRASRLETDPEKRKQLRKNAMKTVLYSTAGAAIGLVSAEYSGKAVDWLKDRFGSNETGVDGVSGAAPKVSGVQPQQQTPDFSRLNENQLDAKLHELGVNPDRFENMSRTEKMFLLNKRVSELGDLAKEDAAAVPSEGGNVSEAQLKHMMKLNADRHPGVDMNKIYSQLESAGIKNPQEAFYKLEQSRLLAPNDKIMTVDGTNIRDTMARALKGEKLTAADMKIIGRSIENVDNTGHYLNDVRAQGGTGYSYRPGGKPIENENTAGAGTKVHTGSGSERTGTEPEGRSGGSALLDIEKMSDEDKMLYLNMMKSFKDKGVDNWQLEANKEYLHYRQLLTDGKTAEAEALAKSFKTPAEAETAKGQEPAKQDENSPYKINSGDSKQLISAKREAAQAEAAYKSALAKVKLTEAEVKAVENLPVDDPKRLAAEYKLGQAMKDEVKKQFEFSKKELKLAKAECNQLGDVLEDRKKMEARIGEIGKELKRYGIEKTDAPKMTGDYGEDKRSVREYFKDVLRNKKHSGPSMKLLKEREELLEKMKVQGPRQLMEEKYAEAEAKVDALSKRELYRENEAKETAQAEPARQAEPTRQAEQNQQSEPQTDPRGQTAEEKVNQMFGETSRKIEGAADKYATTNLSAASQMKAGEMFWLKDQVGNNQFVGVDKEGHAFKITEVRNGGPGTQIIGDVYKIEVDKDHPLYNDLHDKDVFKREKAKELFYNNFKKDCLNEGYTKVAPIEVKSGVNNGISVQNTGGRD